MGIIHTLNLPKQPQTWFIASDWHSGHIHLPSFDILVKYAQKMPRKQRNLIILGDFLDMPFFMPKDAGFQQWKDRKDGVDQFFLPEYEKEIKWGNDTLDALQSIFETIIFCHGNHDKPRVDHFLEKYCPEGYKPNFDIERSLNLFKRKIPVIDYNDWIDMGKLSMTHGMYHGSSCHKKHYEACGGNVLFGHIHSSECKTFTARGETRCSWSLPAMCDLNPVYIKNAETNWQNGFATLVMRPDGNFNLNINLVINNELILPDGTVIKYENTKKS